MWSTPRISKIGQDNIKDFVKKAIRNILHAKIDVNRKILIDEFPGDAVQAITRMQCQFENMKFA